MLLTNGGAIQRAQRTLHLRKDSLHDLKKIPQPGRIDGFESPTNPGCGE